jgi:hypothetical protein
VVGACSCEGPKKPNGARGKLLTFTVIAEAHLSLAEADRVFARTDAIELLEVGLLDILAVQNC